MKSKFLDTRNCHALLPQEAGLPLAQRLEHCLGQINSKDGPLRGSIDRLIEHNKNTRNRSRASRRHCNSSIEIAQLSDVGRRTINTQAIEGPERGPAKLHTIFVYPNGIEWKTIVPLQFLLKGWGDANRGHQCYIHAIAHSLDPLGNEHTLKARRESDSDDYYYVGVTGRNWLLRLSEHLGEIGRGSNKRFHAAWRRGEYMKNVLFISSLMDINLSYEDAMNWEELHVDRVAYGPNGLNMIPGGFKGLKFLHEHRITNGTQITLEARDKAIAEYLRQNPRKGIPNPFMAELWENDEHYLKVIESRPKTLSPDQVRKIRELARAGWSVSEITKETGALNPTQVKKVISGKTYRRIR